jgi:hypothetical protein
MLKRLFLLAAALLPTPIAARPIPFDGVRCTEGVGIDMIFETNNKPEAAGPDAIQNTRKILIDRFGEPKFERQLPDGVALVWVVTEGYATPEAKNIILQLVEGTLHITCGSAF